jgi:hypothetical protein
MRAIRSPVGPAWSGRRTGQFAYWRKPGNTRQGESMKVEKVTAVVRVVVGALAVAVVLAMAV